MRCLAMLSVVLMIFLPLAGHCAGDEVDPALITAINEIRAIDNHMHADAVYPARSNAWKQDNPVGVPRYPDVVPLARSNPEWRIAWRALYAYEHDDIALPHLQELLARKKKAFDYFGSDWPASVLEQARVDVALVNAVRLGPGLDNKHFRWVPYGDPLLRPFAGDKAHLMYFGGEISIAALLRELGLATPPPTLAAYRTSVIDATLARYRKQGAVALKFLSAYARGLDFEAVTDEAASSLYAKGLRGQAFNDVEQKALEDYLLREVAASAGASGLVVHIHTGNGDGPYFNNQRANPGFLENAINSRPLRDTKFVLLHGGWPFHSLTQAMIDKPNTYADFSAQTFYLTTHAMSEILRDWLSWHPEKVLFGSDAYSDTDSPLTDWEEKEWLMTYKARRALGVALTAMINNREITRERALEIARMVLHDTAAKLYGIH